MHRFGIISYLFLLAIASVVYGQESVNQSNGNKQDSEEESKELQKKVAAKRSHLLAHMADRMNLDGEGLRHIRKHLIDVAGHGHLNDALDIERGDNIKGIFYFFRLHDDDNNQKLDGLEWLKALTDFHESDKVDKQKEGGKDFKENEAEAIIDELLEKHDIDNDGMIDFVELMNTKVDSFMTELNRDDELVGREQRQQHQQQDQQQDHQQDQQQQQDQQHQQDQQQQDNQQVQQDQQQQQHQQQDQQQQQQQDQQQDHQQVQQQQDQQQEHQDQQQQDQQQ